MQNRPCVIQSDHSTFKQPETAIPKGNKMVYRERNNQDDDGKRRPSNKDSEYYRIDVVHDRKEQFSAENRSADKLEDRGADSDSRTSQRTTNNNNQEQINQAQVKPKLSFSVDSIMSSSSSSSERDSRAHGSQSVCTEHTSPSHPRENNNDSDIAESDSENVDIENVDSDSDDESHSYLDTPKYRDRHPSDDRSRSEDGHSMRNENDIQRLKEHQALERDARIHGTFSVDGLLRSAGSSRLEDMHAHRPPIASFLGGVSPVDMARWSQLAFPSMPGLSAPSFMNPSKYFLLESIFFVVSCFSHRMFGAVILS